MATGALHHRRSIRLKEYDYTSAGAYFVTLVTFERRSLFGEILEHQMRLSAVGRIAMACWEEIPQHFPSVELGSVVIMPNHIHGVLVLHHREATSSSSVGARHAVPPGACHGMPLRQERFGKPRAGSLGTVLRQYKGSVTRLARSKIGAVQLWQRNYYERVIRDEAEWQKIHLYIESNPLNWERDHENPALIQV